jgi:hypothetical protein
MSKLVPWYKGRWKNKGRSFDSSLRRLAQDDISGVRIVVSRGTKCEGPGAPVIGA